MGIGLFLVFVLVIGWLLAAALSKQKPPNKRKTIRYPTQSAAVQITVGSDDNEDYEQDDFDEEDDEYVRPLPSQNSLGRGHSVPLVFQQWLASLGARVCECCVYCRA